MIDFMNLNYKYCGIFKKKSYLMILLIIISETFKSNIVKPIFINFISNIFERPNFFKDSLLTIEGKEGGEPVVKIFDQMNLLIIVLI